MNVIIFDRLLLSVYTGKSSGSEAVERHILTETHDHLEWEGLDARLSVDKYSTYVNSTITVKRRSYFYAIVLIFPTALLNLLSLVVFTLPTNSTERENFTLTLMLTYFVLVLIIVDSSPPTGDQIPKLGLYVLMCTAIVGVTFGMSLILIEVHEHKKAKQRKMSRGLFCILQKLCCFDHYLKECQKKIKTKKKKYEVTNPDNDKEDKTDTDEDIETFKWHRCVTVLNYIFFAMTLIAHILLPICLFVV